MRRNHQLFTIIALLLLLFCCGGCGISGGGGGGLSSGDGPLEEWSQTFGEYGYDYGVQSVALDDGSVVLVGDYYDDSNDRRLVVVKYDDNGIFEWSSLIGQAQMQPKKVLLRSDGGFAIYSAVLENELEYPALSLVSSSGIEEQTIFYTSIYDGRVKDMVATDDGGYLLMGTTMSGIYVGSYDIYVKKVNAQGIELWTYSYGTSGAETGNRIYEETSGYVIVGSTQQQGVQDLDLYILRISDEGEEVSSFYLSQTGNQSGVSLLVYGSQYIVAGYNDEVGNVNISLQKISNTGDIVWQQSYGGVYDDIPFDIIWDHDLGFVIAASTKSIGNGEEDAYLLATSSDGTEEWSITYGGSYSDVPRDICTATDGGYFMTGYTESFGSGNTDLWLMKLTEYPLEDE